MQPREHRNVEESGGGFGYLSLPSLGGGERWLVRCGAGASGSSGSPGADACRDGMRCVEARRPAGGGGQGLGWRTGCDGADMPDSSCTADSAAALASLVECRVGMHASLRGGDDARADNAGGVLRCAVWAACECLPPSVPPGVVGSRTWILGLTGSRDKCVFQPTCQPDPHLSCPLTLVRLKARKAPLSLSFSFYLTRRRTAGAIRPYTHPPVCSTGSFTRRTPLSVNTHDGILTRPSARSRPTTHHTQTHTHTHTRIHTLVLAATCIHSFSILPPLLFSDLRSPKTGTVPRRIAHARVHTHRPVHQPTNQQATSTLAVRLTPLCSTRRRRPALPSSSRLRLGLPLTVHSSPPNYPFHCIDGLGSSQHGECPLPGRRRTHQQGVDRFSQRVILTLSDLPRPFLLGRPVLPTRYPFRTYDLTTAVLQARHGQPGP